MAHSLRARCHRSVMKACRFCAAALFRSGTGADGESWMAAGAAARVGPPRSTCAGPGPGRPGCWTRGATELARSLGQLAEAGPLGVWGHPFRTAGRRACRAGVLRARGGTGLGVAARDPGPGLAARAWGHRRHAPRQVSCWDRRAQAGAPSSRSRVPAPRQLPRAQTEPPPAMRRAELLEKTTARADGAIPHGCPRLPGGCRLSVVPNVVVQRHRGPSHEQVASPSPASEEARLERPA